MIGGTRPVLIYRASINGFSPSDFHSFCDGKSNTVTIIKNNLNYVFGGYTAVAWNTLNTWMYDASAFIFSLRRNGVSSGYKFNINNSQRAVFSQSSTGPHFGYDINIEGISNTQTGSNTNNFGYAYNIPDGYTANSNETHSFLAGIPMGWLTTEIEVFQDQGCVYSSCAFDSFILSQSESTYLRASANANLGGNMQNPVLLYRASRDGFTISAFQNKCLGRSKTITIIKNNWNFVFGAFSYATWTNDNSYHSDSSAFIFRWRKNGISTTDSFWIKNSWAAIVTNAWSFGYGLDITISDNSNIFPNSYTSYGTIYNIPNGYTVGSNDTNNFLAGAYSGWLTTEIEVYQL